MGIFTLRSAGMAASVLTCIISAVAASAPFHPLSENWETHLLRAPGYDSHTKKAWEHSHSGNESLKSTISFLSNSPVSEATMFTVTPLFTDIEGLDVIEYSFAFATDDPDTPYRAVYFDEDFSIPFSMPGGIYDFIFLYSGEDGIRVILKEDVKVDSDMEMVVEMPESLSHVTYRPVLPDGERIATEVWTENSEDEWNLVQQGNCIDAAYTTMIRYKGRDFVAVERNIMDRVGEDGTIVSGSETGDLWLTPSVVFSSYQIVQACCPESNVVIVMGPATDGKTEITNNLSDYDAPVTASFTDCMIMPEIPEDPMFPDPYINGNISFNTFYGNTYVASKSQTIGNKTWDYTTYSICVDPALKDIEIQPSFMKIFAIEYDEDTWAGIPYSIVAPLYSPSRRLWGAGHQSEIVTNNIFLGAASNQEGGEAAMEFNEFYSFPQSEEVVFGDNTPVTVLLRPDNFDYSYVGRYGEVRYLDNLFNTLSVKCDGKVVCDDYSRLNELFWSDEYKVDGEWSIEINNENLLVEGLKARNHCQMNFVKGERGLTPTVMQLQMRTTDDKVTDKFSTAADALLTFYAGSFEYHMDQETWSQWFTYQPLKHINVEVAPYGSEEYSPLEIKEDEGKFVMPGYGAYYYAELIQMTQSSATGWFDVRISLEDNQGNTQVQTVSPAFKIESLTDITGMTRDMDEIRISGNNIIMPSDAVVFTAEGIVTNGKNLEPGVYIVCTPRTTAKCVIR